MNFDLSSLISTGFPLAGTHSESAICVSHARDTYCWEKNISKNFAVFKLHLFDQEGRNASKNQDSWLPDRYMEAAMKKHPLFYLIPFILVFAVLFSPAVGALAQEDSFTETFDEESLPGWERSEQAVVQNGVLKINPGHFAVKFGDYDDATISVKVKRGGPGIVFIRYAMYDEASYAVIMVEDAIILEKTLAEQPKELGSYDGVTITQQWIELKITHSGGNHQVYLDGESLITATDEEPLQGGGIGFWVDGESAAEFDDLSVSPVVAGEEPTGGEEAAASVEQPTAPAAPAAEATSAPLSVSDLIDELASSQANPTELTTFIVNLLLSVVLSYILSRVYVHWGSSLSNRRRFAANFILITVTTTFIILVVRSSVALSLGLVGALSIVRFRAAIKEPEELAYLFFAIAIGIGLGDNQRLITVIALGVAILILGVRRLFRSRQADFNLHLSVASHNPAKVELEEILAALKPHCAQLKLVRFDDSGAALESSFLVEFRNMAKLKEAKAALRSLSNSLEITFLDNQGIW
jgi:hypothetical protein